MGRVPDAQRRSPIGKEVGAESEATAERERLLRRNRELSILNAIAEGLNRAVDLGEALRSALALVADLLDLRAGWVWLLDEQSGEPVLAAAQHLPPALRDQPERMEGSCYCLRSFRAGDMHGAANVNVIECSRLQGLVEGTEGLHFHASIPLYAGDEKLGVLNVARTDWRELTAEELRLLYTIGYQVGIAVERARLHARAAALATAEERARLARELHDSLAQLLTAIALQLETADALMASRPVDAHSKVTEALRLTREALRETRSVVQDLRAGALQDKSLPEALRELAASYAAIYRIAVRVTASGPAARLAPHLEAGLYRIAQESLNNVVKHAHARHAWVRLAVARDVVRLSVRDDGVGFEPRGGASTPGRSSASGGFGLTGMRERAKLLGGTLRVESAPGAGTRVIATVPLAGGPP